MKLTSEQQKQLRTALVTAFRNRPFDATSIVLEANNNLVLAAVLAAVIPRCENISAVRRPGVRFQPEGRSRFRSVVIRKAVGQLDLNTDGAGYWLNRPADALALSVAA